MPNGRWKRSGSDGWSCCAKRLARPPSSFFILCLDETGDRKKGHTTDYVASQYIGNLQTLANGIVSVNAYGVLGATTFPLLFRIFKPQTCLKAGDVYKTKPQLAIEIIEELLRLGVRFRVVLADSLYGESGPFISALHRLGLQYVVAIRSTHGVWMLPGQRMRRTRWRVFERVFERVFTDGTSQERFIRETIFGTRRTVRYYQITQITTDPQTLPPETTRDHPRPPETTWDLMTNQLGKIEDTVGTTFGLRTWIEYGFKHAKDQAALGRLSGDRLCRYRAVVGTGHERLYPSTLVSLQTAEVAALAHLAPPPDASSTARPSCSPA